MSSLLPMNPWLWSHALGETFAAGFDPLGVGIAQRDQRLAQLLTAALSGSPFYRQRYPRRDDAPRLERFVPVSKAELMHHFDDWATDREIQRAGVEPFIHDAQRIGDPYLGRYLVWTSSGTTGEPGIFVQDALSLAAFDALDTLRLQHLAAPAQPWPMWGQRQRFAFVAATGGHFAGVVSFERLRRIAASTPLALQWLAPQLQTFSVLQPLSALADELRAFAPTVLVTYPSCADALAQAQADVASAKASLATARINLGFTKVTAPIGGRVDASTLTPDPVYARFYYSHPPAAQRLAALQRMAAPQPA